MRASPERAAAHGPPERAFAAFLARAARRQRALAATTGAAAGLGIAGLATALGLAAGSLTAGSTSVILVVTAALSVLCAAIAAFGFTRPGDIPALIEARTPASRNLLRTAAELTAGDADAPPYMSARVLNDATVLANRIDLRTLFPARPVGIAAVAAFVVWAAALGASTTRGEVASAAPRPSSPSAATLEGIEIVITPPAYAGQPALTAQNPARVVALAGSRLRITVAADAAAVTLDTIATSGQTLQPTGARTFAGDVVADADGFLAVVPIAADGSAGPRRLVGLTVTPDEAPRVRVTAPGRDMILPDGNQTVPLTLEADDDLGLATLAIKYTRIGGSGENFTFTDGELAVDVTRTTDRTWSARRIWPLAGLKLEPGDMVIYRGVATDRRPGAVPAESETFILEVAAPGSLAGSGFAIDDRENRYAISQQMVILKTERLIASRRSMSAEDYAREAQGIAAEQRQVRAEFVFMMGGELSDAGLDAASLGEEHEAAGEDDLAAGRLVNQGRADLIRAIRTMSRAAARLAETDAPGALPIEKDALGHLQRAFSRNRYILRTLSERERLDLTRRLTGVLASLARDTRPALPPAPDARIAALRRALADLSALSARPTDAATTALAQRVLAIDAAAAPLRDVAAALTTAAAHLARGAGDAAVRAELDRAAHGLATAARTGLPEDPARTPDPALDALAGRLADALRRRGPQ